MLWCCNGTAGRGEATPAEKAGRFEVDASLGGALQTAQEAAPVARTSPPAALTPSVPPSAPPAFSGMMVGTEKAESSQEESVPKEGTPPLPQASVSVTPDVFLSLFDNALFHLAADEVQLGPKIQIAESSGETMLKLELATFMAQVFQNISNNLVRGPSTTIDNQMVPCHSRRRQSTLGLDPASHGIFQQKGFENVTPSKGSNAFNLTAWLKMDYTAKRTFAFFDMPSMPFSINGLLPVVTELDQFPLWMPFCRSGEILHQFPGSKRNLRLVRVIQKVGFFNIEQIYVMCLEDRLDTCRSVVIYCFSPPNDVMTAANGAEWMGARIPAPSSSKFVIRMPFDYLQVTMTPESPSHVHIQCDISVVDLVPPIGWLIRFFWRELFKRIPGLLVNMVAEAKDNEIGVATRMQPEFYSWWQNRFEKELSIGGDT